MSSPGYWFVLVTRPWCCLPTNDLNLLAGEEDLVRRKRFSNLSSHLSSSCFRSARFLPGLFNRNSPLRPLHCRRCMCLFRFVCPTPPECTRFVHRPDVGRFGTLVKDMRWLSLAQAGEDSRHAAVTGYLFPHCRREPA